MRTTMTTFCMLLLAGGLSSSGFATDTSTPAKPAAAPALHAQTVCPVMGKPIDSASYTDIQGQRVYHCCSGCTKRLLADPDKYFKQAAADSILFQNTQKSCPVSGEALTEKTVFSDYEGRRIFFCCEKCQKRFATDPQKYLKGMDATAKSQDSIKDKSHSGH